MKCGIYIIVTPSGKWYLGSSNNVKRRFIEHRKMLRNGKHVNRYLQHAWNKYGEAHVLFRFVLSCAPADRLKIERRIFIALKPDYNLSDVFGSYPSHLGIPKTAEHRANISRALRASPAFQAYKARGISKETGAKIASSNRGKKRSAETRAKMVASNARRSPEYKKIISEKQTVRWARWRAERNKNVAQIGS